MMFHSASTMDWYWEGSDRRISAFSFSDLSSSSMLRSRILGSLKDLGCCSKPAYEKVFLKATPSTRNESRRPPPWAFLMPIILRSSISGSRVATASTTILEKNSFSPLTSLELRLVEAHFCSRSLRSWTSLAAMDTASSLTWLAAMSAACRKALMMLRGCTPSSMKGLASLRNSPASSTTVVVPSPTSESCDSEMSTSDLAAGCTISSSRMMVAPSLEMVVPLCPWMSLSMPRGPRVVRMVSTTAMQALMLLISCGLPWLVSVPSFSRIICGCIMPGCIIFPSACCCEYEM
mmetsp:Transcript_14037/g.36043  ORF Transcript_14037/g.36043 Transcript_14037/m.36043 type:complete len:291 (-) Transcript_14037:99-971(-)